MGADLRAQLLDEANGMICDLDAESPILVVAFGGIARQFGGIAAFELLRSLDRFAVKKAFLRDHAQAWYHRGVQGVGDDIESVADRLDQLTREVERTVMIGGSAGGYAALLFGALVETDATVHAFSPQTFISPELRARYRDGRWPAEIEAMGEPDPRYADLAPVLAGGDMHVYYSAGDRLDRIHARHVAHAARLYSFEHTEHTLIRHLRDTGWLRRWLRGITALPGTGHGRPAGAPPPASK
jgi:hypothetical protein